MSGMPPKYLSIGQYCGVAYQIRRHTNSQNNFFFDWLMTEGDSYKSILLGNDVFFRSQNWVLVDDNTKLLDKGTGLKFLHEFPVCEKKGVVDNLGQFYAFIDRDKVEGHLCDAKLKFIHLKDKFIEAMKQNNCVLVRKDDAILTTQQATENMDCIFDVFSQISSSFRVILASTGCDQEFSSEDRMFVKLDPTSDWKGDNRSWDRVFLKAAKIFSFVE